MTHAPSKPSIALFMFFSLAIQNGQADPLPIEATSSVKEVMLALTIPASDYIWSIQESPEDDAAWDLILLNADKLARSGKLLLDESRVQEGEIWSQQAHALIDAAGIAAKASKEKSFDLLMDAGDAIYNSCASCHAKYLPE